MGDQRGQRDNGDPSCDYWRDQSPPHPHHGLVQSQTPKGMEVVVPSDSNKFSVGLPTPDKSSLGKDDRSLVEVPLRHPRPERSEEIGLKHHSSSINDFDIVRSDTEGEFVHEENVGKPSHYNGIHGQLACYKAIASLPTHHGVQYSLDSCWENDGCTGTLHDIDA